MSVPLLFELAQDRAASVRVVAGRALAEWFGNGRESETANPDLASVVRNTEDLIGEAATFPDLMRRVCLSTGLRIEAHLVDDYAAEGETLRRAFSTVAGALEKLDQLTGFLEKTMGRPLTGHAALAAAATEVERLRENTLKHWPWPPTEEDVQRVRAEVSRGEALELDEAFAEIAGVSMEEWKRRVVSDLNVHRQRLPIQLQ